ncbi:hypothetical protein [Streptomyces sp. NPDC093071]|uniref:hypothetical protein n=1 Tax=Streptomyces sp. NPDC093071 TaxID=3366022 RepID=UPI00380F9350
MVPAADRLITPTPGAAAEIAARWNRTATVLPHPHVVEPSLLIARPRPHRDGFRVGVHAKSLRANMAVPPVVRVLAETVAGLDGAELVVNIHREVDDPAAHAHDPALMAELRKLADRGALTLRVHDYFDDQLWEYLSGLDLSVLPYSFGTHSGWLEGCHDLGTAVAAPDCGHYAQQRPCLTYGHSQRGGLDAASLDEAVREAYRTRPAWRASTGDRAAERTRVAAAHREIYGELL